MLAHDDDCSFFFLVDLNLSNLGRAECLRDELLRVLSPLDDVDLLASQFVHDLTDPGTARSDARTFRVDVGIIRRHRDLRTMTGFSGDRPDFDGSVEKLRHFELEESTDKIRMRAGNKNLRTLCLTANLENQCLDTGISF